MKVLSKGSVYGLRALCYIAAQKDQGAFVGIRKISEELNISFHFLTKILQQLTQQDILESYRGPNGGITLKKPAQDVLLIDVVHILEGEDFFDSCILGLPGCGSFKPCPMHEFWKTTREAMKDEFKTTTLADLGAKVSEKRLRING